jgi:hypothetical protein
MEIVPYSYSSGRDLELELPPFDVKRQDSLYRDATMPAHAGHHGQVRSKHFSNVHDTRSACRAAHCFTTQFS